MITSLISGLPRRETCCHGPDADIVPFALRTRFFCRLDEAHTPRTASGSFGLVTSRWSLVNWRSGTRMAIEFVLNPLTLSTPGSAGSGAAWRVLNGRSPVSYTHLR